MSGFQIIESLCALTGKQNAIIQAMNLCLGELGAVFGEDKLYRQLIGREFQAKGGDTIGSN